MTMKTTITSRSLLLLALAINLTANACKTAVCTKACASACKLAAENNELLRRMAQESTRRSFINKVMGAGTVLYLGAQVRWLCNHGESPASLLHGTAGLLGSASKHLESLAKRLEE